MCIFHILKDRFDGIEMYLKFWNEISRALFDLII
jgi:hypothetical protein